MSSHLSTKWPEYLTITKMYKQDSEILYWDLKLGFHQYEDVIFYFPVTFEVALSEASLIQFTSENVSLRIWLIVSSRLRLGRPIGLFRLGLFIEMLTDIHIMYTHASTTN